MHKTVIAFAIAGLAAAPAFADSNVTIYGSIDYGYGMRNGDSGLAKNCASAAADARQRAIDSAGCPKSQFASGVSVPNRLGFKGSEDLGNGTKVIFELEAGFLAEDGTNSIPGQASAASTANTPGSGPVFRRHSWVGLTGEWGTVLGGRVDGARYGVFGRYDPFEQGGVANAASLSGHVTRGDNAIAYVTPNLEGLYAVLAYTPSLIGQARAYNSGDIRDWIIQPNYVQGPLSVTLNYEHLTVHNSPVDAKIDAYTAGVSYDFGVAKISGLYDHVKTSLNGPCNGGAFGGGMHCDANDYFVGVVVPVTENDKVRASWVDFDDRSPTQDSCRKWGIGAQHYLSKRTNFYADYAQITQRDKGHCTIYATPTAGSADAGSYSNETGVGTRGYDLGIVHRF